MSTPITAEEILAYGELVDHRSGLDRDGLADAVAVVVQLVADGRAVDLDSATEFLGGVVAFKLVAELAKESIRRTIDEALADAGIGR